MVTIQLALAAAGNLLQAFLFAFVGYALARKFHAGDRARFAARAFVLWWYLMAAQGLVVATMDVGVALGWPGMLWYHALYGVNILMASAQIWALGYYLIYLWTGREHTQHLWLGLFAAAYFIYFFVLVLAARPAVQVGTWATGLDLGLDGVRLAVLGTLFFLPIFTLLAAYFLLAFEVRSETQRLRVIVLGVVAALWNLSLVDRFATDAARPAPFLGFLMVLNLAWIVVLYFAYFPPKWWRRRQFRRKAAAAPQPTEEPVGTEGS